MNQNKIKKVLNSMAIQNMTDLHIHSFVTPIFIKHTMPHYSLEFCVLCQKEKNKLQLGLSVRAASTAHDAPTVTDTRTTKRLVPRCAQYAKIPSALAPFHINTAGDPVRFTLCRLLHLTRR